MSDLSVSALPGSAFDGIVSVREMGLQGMVTLKANLDHDRTAAAVKGSTGADMPAPRRIVRSGAYAVAWMARDELLILCPHAEADAMVARFAEKLSDRHHLAVNVSDARVMFALEGASWRDVLGKLTPADLAPGVFAADEMRRTRLSQVPAAIWMESAENVRVVAFRSVAQYVFDLLSVAAKPGGEVGYYTE